MYLLPLLLLVSLAHPSHSHSIRVINESLPSAMMYLMKYGYMDVPRGVQKSAPLMSQDGLRDYIREFQSFAGLPQTGDLDDNTVRLMNTPRCGVKDIVGKGLTTRKKRYALQGSRWKVKDLTYKISKYPTTHRLSVSEVDIEIGKALEVWAEVTDLTFEQRRAGRVHIDIRFEDGEHGDGDPFDGMGGTLAHAYFPVYGGDAHFDNSEYWTINSYSGTNLLQTAAHEFGHSLGLSHSDQYKALMAPFYRGYEAKVTLDRDDITAVQALYGKKSEKVPAKPVSPGIVFPGAASSDPGPSSTQPGDEEICTDSRIDSMVTTQDGVTYAFKEDQFWKLTDDSIAPGYPKYIADSWPNLPSSIDASFTWTNGKTYLFKGSQYWRFTNTSPDPDYPKDISKGFDGIPDNIDAAFVWSGNGKIYFFKGPKYWRFDPDQRPPVKSSYPRPISNWEGIPDDIDDALQYTNGYTYFFKKGSYWRFDDRAFRVDIGDPPFPRAAAYWWFGCEAASSTQESG